MTTEEKIREAFDKYSGGYVQVGHEVAYLDFKAGYLVLLNSLELLVVIPELYALPEGVTRDLARRD